MKKFAIIGLCVLLCAAALIGCESKPDLGAVVAVINGTELTLGEFENQYANLKEYYLLNANTDLDAEENADLNKSLREEFLDAIIQETVLRQEITNLGLDTFTEEEEAEILADAESEFDYYRSLYRNMLTDMTDAQAEAVLPQMLQENGVTVEGIANSFKLSVMKNRHREKMTEGIEVSDNEIQWAYEDYNAGLVEDLAASRSMFPSLWNNDILLTTRLEGFYAYEWILIPIDAEKESEITALHVSGAPAYETKKAEYLAEIEEQATAVLNRILAGEDFKTVQKEVGNGGYYDVDNPPQGFGYCISDYNQELYPDLLYAALDMTTAGELKPELVGANDGYYIIMCVGEIDPEGAVTMEDALEVFRNSALESAKESVYNFYLEAVAASAEVTKNLDILN